MRRRDFIMVERRGRSHLAVCRKPTETRNPTVGILWHAGSVAEEAIFLTQFSKV